MSTVLLSLFFLNPFKLLALALVACVLAEPEPEAQRFGYGFGGRYGGRYGGLGGYRGYGGRYGGYSRFGNPN